MTDHELVSDFWVFPTSYYKVFYMILLDCVAAFGLISLLFV